MAVEVERKFLVKNDTWRALAPGVPYIQGYLSVNDKNTVRVRIAGDVGYFTIKGKTKRYTRAEFEYPIPRQDAQEMLDTLCQPYLVEKTRYRIPVGDLLWEVDDFVGLNQGLVMAEVELSSAEQTIALPDWVGEEVSDDPRYFNSYLSQHPFTTW
jgi:CYTH domain-containing protein